MKNTDCIHHTIQNIIHNEYSKYLKFYLYILHSYQILEVFKNIYINSVLFKVLSIRKLGIKFYLPNLIFSIVT